MAYTKEYIEELIRRKIMGEITPAENIALASAKKHYSEEAFVELIVEVLLGMDNLPEDSFSDWTPDFADIQARGDELRNQLDQLKARRKQRNIWRRIGKAGIIILPLIALIFFLKDLSFNNGFIYDSCGSLTDDTEVPVSESSCLLSWGDDNKYISKGAHGELLQVGNMQLIQLESGLLKLSMLPNKSVDPNAPSFFELETSPQEQCVMEMPDGTLIRLRAQSVVRYTFHSGSIDTLALNGVAYVCQLNARKNNTFVMSTNNGLVKAYDSEFLIEADENYTHAAVLNGRVSLGSDRLGKELLLNHKGATGTLLSLTSKETLAPRDSFIYATQANFKKEMMWTKALRAFKDMPLEELVDEMSTWYGYQLINGDCIPKGRTITGTLCYKQDVNDFIAMVKKESGLTLYKQGTTMSFCPDNKEKNML